MFILKLKFCIVLVIIFFASFNFASASVSFNEISISPTENRFIELYNSGSSSVDLTGWYIQRKTATGTSFGSLVSKTYFEGIEIKANGYLLISKSSLDNSNIVVDNLTLTESNTIQIKNSNQEVVDSLEYGIIPEGKSTQKISGNWVIGSITPGEKNLEINNEDEQNKNIRDNNNYENINNNQSVSTKIEEKNVPRIVTAKIISPKIVFEGMPFLVNSLITTNKKEILAVGKYNWNFGDGSTKEDTSSNEFEHIYFYPGEYVLSLDYYEGKSSIVDDSDRVVIKVVSREILISSVGDSKDPYIEIENKSNYEIILSGWTITAGVHYFKIPDGTVLLANKKVKFSSKITGFILEDFYTINITNRSGEIVASYPASPVKNIVKKVSSESTFLASKEIVNDEIKKEEENNGVINLNDLGASAVNTDTELTPNYAYWGLGGIIVIGMTSVLLLRRKKEEIGYLEDEIRAEDFKIIE